MELLVAAAIRAGSLLLRGTGLFLVMALAGITAAAVVLAINEIAIHMMARINQQRNNNYNADPC